MQLHRPRVAATTLLALVAVFLTVADNGRFWGIVSTTLRPISLGGVGAGLAIGATLTALSLLILMPLSVRGLLKPWLSVALLLTALATHFIDNYGAVIDRHALASLFESDAREAGEWLSLRMLLDLVALGIVPTLLVWWVDVQWQSWPRELWLRVRMTLVCIGVVGLSTAGFGRDIASLVRNHSELKHLTNPYAIVAASLSYLDHARNDGGPIRALGLDAHRRSRAPVGAKPIVLVIAVGESARASSFSLNGYRRDTNPELSKLPIVNFPNVSSCGTNTATSLPCMFSTLGRADYDDALASHSENILDVLAHAGYQVVWLDNNSNSKHIAARVREVDFATAHEADYCREDGCWDGILIEHLREELAAVRSDTVFVIHLIGSHGPAYYHRYPPQFARFTPECRSNELQLCTREAIINAYDNTILYTDHVLSSAVRAVQESAQVDGMMLYVSDHGESTGEGGLYLHGAPYVLAPEQQTRVPLMLWVSDGYARRRRLDEACVRHGALASLSHDNLPHMLLRLADVESSVYRRELDPLSACVDRLPAQAALPR